MPLMESQQPPHKNVKSSACGADGLKYAAPNVPSAVAEKNRLRAEGEG